MKRGNDLVKYQALMAPCFVEDHWTEDTANVELMTCITSMSWEFCSRDGWSTLAPISTL
jgi:hypothetical protein